MRNLLLIMTLCHVDKLTHVFDRVQTNLLYIPPQSPTRKQFYICVCGWHRHSRGAFSIKCAGVKAMAKSSPTRRIKDLLFLTNSGKINLRCRVNYTQFSIITLTKLKNQERIKLKEDRIWVCWTISENKKFSFKFVKNNIKKTTFYQLKNFWFVFDLFWYFFFSFKGGHSRMSFKI